MITERQRDLMLFIQRTIARDGKPPRVDDMAKALGVSARSNVFALLHRLIERGFITCEGGITRSIKVVTPIPEERCMFYIFDNTQKAFRPFEPQTEAAE